MMKKKFLLFTITLFAVALTTISCNNKKAEQNDSHTSEISLDWHGAYSGVLPCADCEGIRTELTLNEDNTFTLISEYILEENQTDTLTGTFSWHEDGNSIKLDIADSGSISPYFKVEENQVRWLNIESKTIEGELAEHYVLIKNGNPMVEDKRWELVEIYGKEVNGSPETHYLIFHSESGMVEAKANCNSISAGYKIKNELIVQFTQGPMTLMACPDDNTEQELLAVLAEADNLSTDGENLSLNKARMAPLAIFKLSK